MGKHGEIIQRLEEIEADLKKVPGCYKDPSEHDFTPANPAGYYAGFALKRLQNLKKELTNASRKRRKKETG